MHDHDSHGHGDKSTDNTHVPHSATRIDLVDEGAYLDTEKEVHHPADEDEDTAELRDPLQHAFTMSTAESGQSWENSSVVAISAGALPRPITT